MLINADYPGFGSLKEMTQSVEVIIVGRVEDIYSRTLLTGAGGYTTFNVSVLQAVKLSAFNSKSMLVSQNGYQLDCINIEVSGDPLMNVGEDYVLFLQSWRNEDRTVRPEYLPTMGGLGMFQVRGGKVYPRMESWTPSASGRSLEDVLNELNSYLK